MEFRGSQGTETTGKMVETGSMGRRKIQIGHLSFTEDAYFEKQPEGWGCTVVFSEKRKPDRPLFLFSATCRDAAVTLAGKKGLKY